MKRLLLLLLLTPSINSMEIPNHALISKDTVKLLHDKTHYYASDENASYRVARHETSSLLRELVKRNAVNEFAHDCKIRIIKHDDATYSLVAQVPGQGGGWLTGQIAGWSVRGAGYAGYAAACFFHPHLLLEAEVAHVAIEAAATGAEAVGYMLPTP